MTISRSLSNVLLCGSLDFTFSSFSSSPIFLWPSAASLHAALACGVFPHSPHLPVSVQQFRVPSIALVAELAIRRGGDHTISKGLDLVQLDVGLLAHRRLGVHQVFILCYSPAVEPTFITSCAASPRHGRRVTQSGTARGPPPSPPTSQTSLPVSTPALSLSLSLPAPNTHTE